jgi:hypothetical protein
MHELLEKMKESIIFAERSLLEIVIRKGGGIRPFEALATLYCKEGATFCRIRIDNRCHKALRFPDNFMFLSVIKTIRN